MRDGLSDEEKWVIEQVKQQVPIILTLPEPDRSRCLLSLSYEYFIADMEEEGFKLLEKADPNYFKDQLKEDMKTIENMDLIVFKILDKLVEIGMIKVSAKGDIQ